MTTPEQPATRLVTVADLGDSQVTVVEQTPQGMKVMQEQRPTMPGYLADAVQHSYARYTPEETE